MARVLRMVLVLSLLGGCAPAPVRSAGDAEAPRRALPPADATVAPLLVALLDERRPAKPGPQDFQNTALKDIVKLTTPLGYRLKTRALEPKVPVVQSLAFASDEQLRNRLLETARWTNQPRTRAEGLLGLAMERNPAHLKYFKEALLDQDVNIQFAAVEALQIWGQPDAHRAEALAYLKNAAGRSWSPLVKVFASQAAWRLGDPAGREKMLVFLRDPGWLSRAMAARYIGELGEGKDADTLLSRIGAERDNKFALAEVCIAALKLLAKKAPAAKPKPGPVPVPTPRPAIPSSPFELEPLIVTAPRINVPRHLVDVRIDNDLVRLLEELAKEPPPEEQVLTAEQEELARLATPTGFALKIRYTDLSIVLTEGLAGTSNYTLIQRLETIARGNPNARARSAALVALGYEPNRRDLSVFQDALRDPNVVVRFAAVEGLSVLGDGPARFLVAGAAQSDASAGLRAFAAQALMAFGDPYGRQLIIRLADDADWSVRAMAAYALGEWGQDEDYFFLLNRMNRESHDFVRAEACLAMLKRSRKSRGE
jgi:HEAT repeat protein